MAEASQWNDFRYPRSLHFVGSLDSEQAAYRPQQRSRATEAHLTESGVWKAGLRPTKARSRWLSWQSKGVDQELAVLMIILTLVAMPIFFVSAASDAAALLFVRGADFLSVFDTPQRDAFAML